MVKRNRKKVRKVSTVFFDQETMITDTQIEKYEGGEVWAYFIVKNLSRAWT